MSDETTPLIFGDALAAELNRPPPPPRWWRRKKKQKAPLTHCENCGTALAGPYCAQCGQPAIDYRRSFPSLLADAADAFFNLDARFFQSFGLLLFKPWRLTNEFIEGKRARHVHPLRVYLIASVTFFLVINFLSRDSHFKAESKSNELNIALGEKSPATPPPVTFFSIGPTPPPGTVEVVPPLRPPRAEHKDMFVEMDNVKDKPPFVSWLEKRAKEKIGPSGDRVDLFMKALLHNIAPMVLCCIPLFAFVLKILYIFKRRFYIDHLIFALHTHAFVFLSTVTIIGIGFLLAWKAPAPFTPIVCTFLGIGVIVQLLIAIRRVYRQNWFATIFKFCLGSVIYIAMLSIAFGITAFLTLLLP